MSLKSELKVFEGNLALFSPTDRVRGDLADVVNAFLDEVKKSHGDRPAVKAIQPIEKDTTGASLASAGELKTLAGQLRAAMTD